MGVSLVVEGLTTKEVLHAYEVEQVLALTLKGGQSSW